jgi:hypothetical protein
MGLFSVVYDVETIAGLECLVFDSLDAFESSAFEHAASSKFTQSFHLFLLKLIMHPD